MTDDQAPAYYQPLTIYEQRALDYVMNAGGAATIATLDDDFDPIGKRLRESLMPQYIIENAEGKLALTQEGRAALSIYRRSGDAG